MNEFICFSLDYHANDYTLYANSFHLLTRAIDSGNMNRMATRNSFPRAMCEFHCTLFHMISAWAISWSEIETNSLIYLYLCLVFFCCLHFSFSLSLTRCLFVLWRALIHYHCCIVSCWHFVSHFIYSICSLFPTHVHKAYYRFSSPPVHSACGFAVLLFVHFIIIMLLAFSRFYFIHSQHMNI